MFEFYLFIYLFICNFIYCWPCNGYKTNKNQLNKNWYWHNRQKLWNFLHATQEQWIFCIWYNFCLNSLTETISLTDIERLFQQSFRAKFELLFVLILENASSWKFHFKTSRRSISSFKNRSLSGTFKKGARFERSACFYATISWTF